MWRRALLQPRQVMSRIVIGPYEVGATLIVTMNMSPRAEVWHAAEGKVKGWGRKESGEYGGQLLGMMGW